MNDFEYKIRNEKQGRGALVWTIFCISLGVYVLDVLFSYTALSKIVSVLMPLYFILWLTIMFVGHYVVKLLFRNDFYTASVSGSEFAFNVNIVGNYSKAIINWSETLPRRGDYPRLTPVKDTGTTSVNIMEAT